MPTPFESAWLNLQLFDLRRKPVLREARAWFTREFNPANRSHPPFCSDDGGRPEPGRGRRQAKI